MRVPRRSGCSLVLSLDAIYLRCFGALFPLWSPLSSWGLGQSAVPVGSAGTRMRGIQKEKRLLAQAEGTRLPGVPMGGSPGAAHPSSQGSRHSTAVWGEILTILVFVPEQFEFPQGEAFPSNSALN